MDKILVLNLNDFDKAKRFVDKANMINSDVNVLRGRYLLDAKSSLGIYTIDLLKPVTVQIVSNDEDEIRLFNELMKEFKK